MRPKSETFISTPVQRGDKMSFAHLCKITIPTNYGSVSVVSRGPIRSGDQALLARERHELGPRRSPGLALDVRPM
jgi:hypothetical protein